MFGNEQGRHYPTPFRPPRYCTSSGCPNHRTAVKFGNVCNACGNAVRER
ncbi:MAG: hypothetical protein UZ00_C0011G0003 [Parcubacteria group bacterium GW2011_GWA1_60_11]|nr:MAG: hypothetical protein UZ00_C0011G0003 [Parcubacteria group bacterium GW2011_GWA1_60_11]